MKVQVLFLGELGSCRSQMAYGFARRFSTEDVEITIASVESEQLDERAVEVMSEVGIDISTQPRNSLSELDLTGFDILISMSDKADSGYKSLPGTAALIRWNIPNPLSEDTSNSIEVYRQVRDQISRRVEDFFSGGYLGTIVSLKRNIEAVMDQFSEGIIVHDIHRNIIWFNRAAERITGYDRKEVIGHDCYDVFNGGFCGGKCSFAEEAPNFDVIEYPLNITSKDGQEKRVEMTVAAIKDDRKSLQGVVVNFRDETEVTHLRHHLKAVQSFHGIIGSDHQMHEIYDLIRDLAGSDCSVLIQGESGTGKELIAGAIHGESRRAGRPFVTVNCGALPEGILESELFGHVRGAFTGAVRDKKGRFELADGGALFLDEVAELSGNMQVKLLRVLQEGVFERVGGEKTVRVDVRVISATNKDLRKLIHNGKFREDLFYRLCVVPITLPPLRERRNDITLLLDHFIRKFGRNLGRSIESISTEAQHNMIDYDWPGNIRELQNALQYAFVKCKGDTIEMEHLPPEIISHVTRRVKETGSRRKKLTTERVMEVMQQVGGNKSKAAKELGVGRATLHRFLKSDGK